MQDHGNNLEKVTLESQPLESVDVYKDLGLFTASDLSWNQHMDKITAKELMVSNKAFLTELFRTGIVYLIIFENQIVLQPLKGMF
ncbi:hypothetical protein pdam_00007637 [Pocillopora damicornis]|uniref:Uncharacterized protein n=1 Tax=Pocillopora damicornis TaxID=46731 RepID=A0A3M6TZP1_POCDA|nr:hypothetical protein pdam_00007637 [Pocillopora damicornis]